MAALVFPLLMLLAMAGVSDGAWCVCRPDASDSVLQKTLDYACGAGADCNPILQNGPCFNPNTVKAHCSYAANSYYQKKGQAQGSCDFTNTAILANTDPSTAGCTYPASASAAGTSPSTTNSGSSTANGLTPTTGAGGAIGGLGPSSSSVSTDTSGAGFVPQAPITSIFLAIIISLMLVYRD